MPSASTKQERAKLVLLHYNEKRKRGDGSVNEHKIVVGFINELKTFV